MVQVARVAGRCLVDHAPTPQTCASLGGVWDDTAAGTDAGAGGRWVGRAAHRLASVSASQGMLTETLIHTSAHSHKQRRTHADNHTQCLVLGCVRECVSITLRVTVVLVCFGLYRTRCSSITECVYCCCCWCCCCCRCWCRCLSAARASKLLELLGPGEAEMVTVDVSHDTSE